MDFPEIPNTLRDCPACGQECVEGPHIICAGCREERLTFIQIVREMGLAAHLDSEGDAA